MVNIPFGSAGSGIFKCVHVGFCCWLMAYVSLLNPQFDDRDFKFSIWKVGFESGELVRARLFRLREILTEEL